MANLCSQEPDADSSVLTYTEEVLKDFCVCKTFMPLF